MLNPGDYKLPKPRSSKINFSYFGYVMADDEDTVEAIFSEDKQRQVATNRTLDQAEKDLIAEDNNFNKLGNKNEGNSGENIEADWLSMCQTAAKPVEKEDVIFDTLEDSKLAENHIIICGMVENIRYFVMPLRAKHLNNA